MVTRIDPVIQAVPRRAEKTDAHMGLGRDESVVDNRKKGESRASSQEWEDMTEVSVVALRGFLQELIGQSASHPPSSEFTVSSTESTANHHPLPENPQASRAARAYQTTGRMVHDRNVTPEYSSVPPPPTSPSDGVSPESSVTGNFSPEEVAAVEGYITALTALELRGIETLYLQRSMTFLESVRDAIESVQ